MRPQSERSQMRKSCLEHTSRIPRGLCVPVPIMTSLNSLGEALSSWNHLKHVWYTHCRESVSCLRVSMPWRWQAQDRTGWIIPAGHCGTSSLSKDRSASTSPTDLAAGECYELPWSLTVFMEEPQLCFLPPPSDLFQKYCLWITYFCLRIEDTSKAT